MIKTRPLYSIKKYKKITNIINSYKLNNFQLISNYGLFCGDSNLFKTLTIKEIVDRVKNVKGDIIEFGVWKGNTSFLIKKIIDIFEIKKKCIYLIILKAYCILRKQINQKKKSTANIKVIKNL